MGAETSSVHVIFFIAATSVAAGVATVLGTTLAGIAQGVSERTDGLRDALGTDVAIVNDPDRVAVNPTVLYVKNVGSRPTDPATLTLLLDGDFVNFTWARETGSGAWATGDVVRLTVPTSEATLAPGDHVARVSTASGAAHAFRFRS